MSISNSFILFTTVQFKLFLFGRSAEDGGNAISAAVVIAWRKLRHLSIGRLKLVYRD